MSTAKKCTHNACGKDYTDDDNSDNACQFHPGTPIFHEGLKGWSCCKKRFCDFSDFLAHPGCAFGRHTDEEQEDQANPNAVLKELSSQPLDRLSLEEKKANAAVRDTTAKVDIPVTVTKSLETALKRMQAKKAEEDDTVKPGQPCTNNACKGVYVDESTDQEDCIHHPGEPVFHEGYKYWSCCPKKKTYDFDEFLDMKGCTTGTHCWVKPPEKKVKKCRHDWFQAADHVLITVFAKCVDPEQLILQANNDSLTIEVVYEEASKYNMELHLGGRIKPQECTAKVMGTKLEVRLPKADGEQWADLEQS